MSEHIIFQSGLFDAKVCVVSLIHSYVHDKLCKQESKGTKIMMSRDNAHSDKISSLTKAIGVFNYL